MADPRRLFGAAATASSVLLLLAATAAQAADAHQITRVTSRDGTQIAVECAGTGPELLIVHGGAGDRTRWTPMIPLLERDFTVCAMDRRAHGQSSDGPTYSLAREAEDITAVVASRKRPVAVLGHSFGGVAVYEAALHNRQISKLILYEPPLQLGDHAAILKRIETAIQTGDRDGATEIFMREIVQVSPTGMAKMKAQPSWPSLVATIETSIRQDRALTAYRWDAAQARKLNTPVLLLLGGLTQSTELQRSVRDLDEALPNSRIVVLEGQEHNAMDSDRPHLAAVIKGFLK